MVSEKPTVRVVYFRFLIWHFFPPHKNEAWLLEDLITFFECTDPSIFAMRLGQWEPCGRLLGENGHGIKLLPIALSYLELGMLDGEAAPF